MNGRSTDDYLWDGSGEPDETLRQLESVLLEYRHDQTSRQTDDLGQAGDLPPDDDAV